jgi:FtsZ-binding cell division protein ZapB
MSDTATMLRDHAQKLIGYEELDDFILFLRSAANQFDDYEQIIKKHVDTIESLKMHVDTIESLGKQVKKLQQEVAELKEEKVTVDRLTEDIAFDINLVASWKEKIQ